MRAMKLAVVSGILLAGCSQENAQLKADCEVIANDRQGQVAIADMGTDTEGFCNCVIELVNARPAEDKALLQATFAQVAAQVSETGEAVEEVASQVVSVANAAPDDEDLQTQLKGIRKVGELIDEIGDGFSDTKACPTPAS